MSLKTVEEPSTIRAETQARDVVRKTASIGMADLELTRWMYCQPGMALSREKAQSCREADATMPTVAQRESVIIIDVMSAAPVVF